MLEYKRNQVEEAISHLLEPTSPQPTQGLRTKVKRLLEADRALHASAGANGNFAFFRAEPPGRGVEIWFSAYEAFALLTGLRLMAHGWPQGQAVSVMRSVRSALEDEHRRILQHDPNRPRGDLEERPAGRSRF
jgi:predicted DNA-binding transcriptional regulator YafY